MARLLITGGAGFIGANFVHYRAARRPRERVVVLDKLTYAGSRASLDSLAGWEALRFVHGDIGDFDLVRGLLEDEGLDTIVHFAAESHVDRSILGPDVFVDTNVSGTVTLLKAAAEAWRGREPATCRFHHVSTDEVYGSLAADAPAFTETTPYDPSSPYAASKAAADHFVRAWQRTYGLPVSISNCSNNYGPFHFPEKLIPLMIVNALDGRPLPIYGDGGNVRDWLYVEDHCRAIQDILERGRAGDTFNIGGGAEVSNLDLVRRLCRLLDARFAADPALALRFPGCPAARSARCEDLVTFVPDRPGHDRRYAMDGRRIAETLGFRPAVDLDTGLARTVDWFLDNEAWWRPKVRRE
jgi:dTDP-glucose 4,6-dehydratase